MKARRILIIIFIFLLLPSFNLFNGNVALADELSDNIYEQMENLDISELEEFLSNNENLPTNLNFTEMIYNLLNGEYDLSVLDFGEYILKIFFDKIIEAIPTLALVILIAVVSSLLKNFRCSSNNEGIITIINFVTILSIVLLLSREIFSIYTETKITIENIAKLVEIMSPIILTLMVASGANVSANIYSPTVSVLSNVFVNVVLVVIVPIICVLIIISILSTISTEVKLSKLSEFFTSIIKWVMGLGITIFSIFLSVQGITSATFDGVSIKAAKYAISNSVPLVGGLLSGSFDLIIAGSIIIKNSIGIVGVFILFFLIISTVINIAIFSLLLKFIAGIIEPMGESKISSFCISISKSISMLMGCILCVGFMFFITLLLMMFSASVFI